MSEHFDRLSNEVADLWKDFLLSKGTIIDPSYRANIEVCIRVGKQLGVGVYVGPARTDIPEMWVYRP